MRIIIYHVAGQQIWWNLGKNWYFFCEKRQNLNAIEKAGPNHDIRQNQRHIKHGSCWTCGQFQESDGRGTESDDKSFLWMEMFLIISKKRSKLFNQLTLGGESSRWSCQLQSCPRTGFRISIISAHDILFPLMTIVLTIWFDSFLIFNLFRFSILLCFRWNRRRASWWQLGGRVSRTGTTWRTSCKTLRWQSS